MAIRLVGLLLLVSGIGGLVAVWSGWRTSDLLLNDLRQAGAGVSPEQTRLVNGMNQISGLVGDAADATDGFAASMTQARTAVSEGSQAAAELAASFQQAGPLLNFEIFGVQPLANVASSFEQNADSFQRLSASLDTTAASLDSNVKDTARVASDLRQARTTLQDISQTVRDFRSPSILGPGLGSLQLSVWALLLWLSIQSLLSILLGIGLILLGSSQSGQRLHASWLTLRSTHTQHAPKS
jgi:hypothetical protein